MIRAAVAAALLAVAAPAADAHVQVRPKEAAPDDPVLWTVLVPSEREAGTRQVELAVPKDVIPFSFEDQPGWTRRNRMNPDGSIKSIVWRGRTPGDGLATFRFLASTPEREGDIRWAALQTYNDGRIVRWIGDPASENPASVTTVTRTAARENAGGEGAAGEGDAAAASAPASGANDAARAGDEASDSTDWLARGLGIAALVVALSVAVVALRRRPRTP
jgi:uncharacterized protein YcnI